MISNFKAPDLNAPRYREKVLSLLNADLFKDFKDKYPMYSDIDNSKLKSIINSYNKKLWEELKVKGKKSLLKYYEEVDYIKRRNG